MEALNPHEKAVVEEHLFLVDTYCRLLSKRHGIWPNSNKMDSVRSDLYMSIMDSVQKFFANKVTGDIKGYILSGFKFTLLKKRAHSQIRAGVEVCFEDLHPECEEGVAVDQMLVDRRLGELELGPAQRRLVKLRYGDRLHDNDVMKEMKISKQRLGILGGKIVRKLASLCVREGLELDDFKV